MHYVETTKDCTRIVFFGDNVILSLSSITINHIDKSIRIHRLNVDEAYCHLPIRFEFTKDTFLRVCVDNETLYIYDILKTAYRFPY